MYHTFSFYSILLLLQVLFLAWRAPLLGITLISCRSSIYGTRLIALVSRSMPWLRFWWNSIKKNTVKQVNMKKQHFQLLFDTKFAKVNLKHMYNGRALTVYIIVMFWVSFLWFIFFLHYFWKALNFSQDIDVYLAEMYIFWKAYKNSFIQTMYTSLALQLNMRIYTSCMTAKTIC